MFKHFRLRSLAVLFLVGFPTVGRGQTAPPATQSPQAPARQSADVNARLQQMVQGSGMSADQVRSRLQAQGLSQSMLDPYLSASPPSGSPNENVFAAISAIGLAPTSEVEALANEARGQAKARNQLDVALIDSLTKLMGEDPSFRETLRSMATSRAAARSQIDSGFALFGMEAFRRTTSEFEPVAGGPVPASYRIGPQDQLALVLTGDVQAYYALTVTPEGMVFIPDVGEIAVANLTMAQLQDVLYTRLGRVHSSIRRGPGATAHFDVTVTRTGVNQVFVNGDVVTPGAYKVSKLGTILSAVYAAGGPTENGTLRRVELRRAGELVATLDLYDYFATGNTNGAMPLLTGDVVFVPPRGGRVRVAGAVIRPATYEVKAGERLADVIRLAGGLRAEADHRRVQIERILPESRRVEPGKDRVFFDVSSAAIDSSDERIEAGDIIRIFTIADKVANRVTVSGSVWSPGVVAYQPGMKLSAALRQAGGVKPETYRGAVQIARLQADASRRMLRVSLRDSIGSPQDDIALQPDDEIQVFSMSDYRPERYVTIVGAVRQGGQVPYREGMNLRDLVIQAGGLSEGALLDHVEIARMPEDRSNGGLATILRPPLDSTYLLERTPDGRYVGPPGLAAPSGGTGDVELKPYDNVLVLLQPDWMLPQTVTIGGEVRFPGTYSLKTKGDRLSDLIERAGGLTTLADPTAVVFNRAVPVAPGAAVSDVALPTQRIALNLKRALERRDSRDNLKLEPGDAVVVPAYAPLVAVRGAVNSPLIVSYVPGADIDFYVQAAGGASARGDRKRAYVMQPGGNVETPKRYLYLIRLVPEPKPGSIVTVPEKDITTPRDFSSILTATTSIVGSLVAIAAILNSRR